MSAYLKDAIERVLATFVVAMMGVLTVAALPWLKEQLELIAKGQFTWKMLLATAIVAGAIAAWDVVKVWLARYIGNKNSASLLK